MLQWVCLSEDLQSKRLLKGDKTIEGFIPLRLFYVEVCLGVQEQSLYVVTYFRQWVGYL